jgi:hypothetical protein
VPRCRPDVAVKFDEVPVFAYGSIWIAGLQETDFLNHKYTTDFLLLQSGEISVGHTREEALAKYHERKPKK